MKAQDILDHCKAVVNGDIPQPLPFWLVADSDGLEKPQYVFYYAKPTDGEADHVALILWGFTDQIQAPTLQLAARLLGLDHPSSAPVVLEWVELGDETASFVSKCQAYYNDSIRSEIERYANGEILAFVCVRVDRIWTRAFSNFQYVDIFEARAWCAEQITKIVTPTPKQ